MAEGWKSIVEDWPETARMSAMEVADKYGAPDIACSDMVKWKNIPGYAWLKVSSMEAEHDFPVEHKDVMDLAIAYKVPADKLQALREFDGSAVVMPTKGLLVAGCFKEGLNLAILNLCNDICKDEITPEEARKKFAMMAMDMMKNNKMDAYLMRLQFTTESRSKTADPDKAMAMSM